MDKDYSMFPVHFYEDENLQCSWCLIETDFDPRDYDNYEYFELEFQLKPQTWFKESYGFHLFKGLLADLEDRLYDKNKWCEFDEGEDPILKLKVRKGDKPFTFTLRTEEALDIPKIVLASSRVLSDILKEINYGN